MSSFCSYSGASQGQSRVRNRGQQGVGCLHLRSALSPGGFSCLPQVMGQEHLRPPVEEEKRQSAGGERGGNKELGMLGCRLYRKDMSSTGC